MNKTLQLVKQIKDTGEDLEWYPTTASIINVIRADIVENNIDEHPSVLDCGAGDGRVLNAITKGKKYAIEKAKPLLNALDREIFVVGTDFEAQTLIDKKVDIIFCNPPYSVYSRWTEKIIKEANSAYVYLVIPKRWVNNEKISEALELRRAKTEVLGSFDFLGADRQARAEVDILRVTLRHSGRFSGASPKVDPFSVWFDEYFKLDIENDEQSKFDLKKRTEESLKNKLHNQMVAGCDLVTVLEELYQKELADLMNVYQSLSNIDPSILKELDINVRGVKEGLCLKVENLKDRYWNELFNNLSVITDKLTVASRKALLSQLTAHTHIDFNVDNAKAVVTWVVKNANEYFDDQLIATVERMTEKANIHLYKSNHKTFRDDDWRYSRHPNELERYQLDYRAILSRMGGIVSSSWSLDSRNGLDSTAADFIDDVCTIASNLNFDTEGLQRTKGYEWDSNIKREFDYKDIESGGEKLLFDVRAFKNGNLHIRFNPNFICRLNVEFGRLKGWLKSPKEAEEELGINAEEAVYSFNSNLQIASTDTLNLKFDKAA